MKRIHLLLVCFLNFISTFAQFSGSGSGTESDPYKIYNADQLYQMRNFPSQEGVYFKLMANIDLTNWISENNPSQGWVPIGSEGESFRGVFDGNNKFITGLFINREKSSYVGLFGYTNNATIKNLNLSGDIVGKSYTGAFIGCAYDTNINNCYFDGTATGKGDYVGGFCGFYNSSRTGSCTITQCKLKGTVSGVNYVGGVLGAFSNSYSSPNVDMCWVEGNVIGTGNYVGGICGQSIYFQGKKITNCGFSGIIKGVDYVGGISGESYIVISNCASIGKIYGSGNCVGGILGSGTRVYNSYSCGIIEGKESVGGIAGLVCADGLDCLVQYNYSNSNVKGANYVGGIVGKATKRNSQSSIAIQYNAALNSIVYSKERYVGRVLAYGSCRISDNKALVTTDVYTNGVLGTVSDDDNNGVSIGQSTFKLKANYLAWGWNVGDDWTILDTESYPYKTWQTAPPVFDNRPVSGSSMVRGHSVDGGIVSLITNDDNKTYSIECNANIWSLTIDRMLHFNEEIEAYARASNMWRSYSVTTTTEKKEAGTESDPYLIYSAYDLANISEDGFYKLMNDIDLSEWINQQNPVDGWTPVRIDVNDYFVFDGDGHKISGLNCKSNTEYAGLFSYINGSNSVIKNLTLDDVDISTNAKYAAGLIGYFEGTVENCKVSGMINATGTYAGLLAGHACHVNTSSVDGSVSGSAQYAGGLCGYSSGNVSKCKSSITVTGGDYAGGLCGKGCDFSESFSTDKVSGATYVGGIVGYLDESIQNCYSRALVFATSNNGSAYAGGVCGYSTGNVKYSYSIGDITSTNAVAGVVCYMDGENAATNNCVAINNKVSANSTSGFAMRAIGGYMNGVEDPVQTCLAYEGMVVSINGVAQRVYDDPLHGTATTMEALKTQSTYTGLDWDFSSIWYMNPKTGLPDFQWNNKMSTQTVTIPSQASMNYGDEGITLPEKTEQGLSITWSCTNTDVVTVDGNVITPKGAGTATVNGLQIGNDDYQELNVSMSVTVNKAPLTITADNKKKQEGAVNPELTVSYTGFVNGDTENSLTTKPTVTTTANANSQVGTYPITASGAVSSNYDITYVEGTLTVVEKQAINELAVEPVSMAPGSEQSVSVSMENESQIIMAEFYLQLPEGFEIATDEDGYYLADINGSRSNRHQLEVSQSADGIYHFLCYSSRNNAFYNNSGELISMTIVCADGVDAGNYKGWIKNIILSDVNKNEINPDDFSFNIEVKDYTMGDVNGDTRINGLDIVEMVDKIMDRPSDYFIFAAGDFDGNGVINGMDLVEEVSLVMSQTISGAKARKAPEKLNPDMASTMRLQKTSDGRISVGMDSFDAYILSQFVVELSDGQQLTDITASDTHHTVAYQPIDGHRYAVVCYSTRNAEFSDNNDMLKISFEGSGTVRISDVMLVDADRKTHYIKSAELDEATGIDIVNVNGVFSKPTDIYSVYGALIKKNARSAIGLSKGIYVVDGKSVFIK